MMQSDKAGRITQRWFRRWLSGARETLHWSPVVATDTASADAACGKGIMIQHQACAGLEHLS
jgi:hypothetical protein